MNKQLINKYKPEFDHWLNGGSLCIYRTDTEEFWEPTTILNWDPFTPETIVYIINDKYVEFRKALAEGKTIEYLGQSSNLWHEVPEPDFNLHPTCYRIKPDEPKFKVGDFVTHESLKITRQITKVDDDFIYFKEGSWALPHVEGFSNKLILWTPIKGEWCWFYDKAFSKYSHLAKFNEMWKNKFRSTTDTPWHFCEPFLNSLPSYLKDK